jgi:hypothetical protein
MPTDTETNTEPSTDVDYGMPTDTGGVDEYGLVDTE